MTPPRAGPTSSTTISTPTGAPAITSATGNNGTASAVVVFTGIDPSANGGSAVTGYIVRAYTSGGSASTTNTCSTNSTTYTCTVSGLSYKTEYVFKVAAINIAGTGTYSPISLPVTLNLTQTITFPTPSLVILE